MQLYAGSINQIYLINIGKSNRRKSVRFQWKFLIEVVKLLLCKVYLQYRITVEQLYENY